MTVGTTRKDEKSADSLSTMRPVSPDEVRAEVRRFRQVFSTKAKTEFAQFYLPSATVFAANAPRMERARLMIVRRARELFGPKSSVGAKLGSVDVQILGTDLAIASYPFHYSVTRTLPNGRRYWLDVPFGRATQIFQRDPNGALRIIHEHMSSADPVASRELPDNEPVNPPLE